MTYRQNKQKEQEYQKDITEALEVYFAINGVSVIGETFITDKTLQKKGIDRIVYLNNNQSITVDDKSQKSVQLFQPCKGKQTDKLYIEIQRTYKDNYVSSGSFISDKKENDYIVIVTGDNMALIIYRERFKQILQDNIAELLHDYKVEHIEQNTQYDSITGLPAYSFVGTYLRMSIEDILETDLINAIHVVDIKKKKLLFI